MRARDAAVMLALLMTAPSAAAPEQPPTYRQIVDRYRASPNDGVERMLALPDDARRAGVEDAARSGSGWSWDELAAAAMMHTDAGFYFLSNQQPGIAQLTDAERLIAASTSVAGHTIFTRRWYATIESVLKGIGDTANAKSFAAHGAERFKATPQRVKALDAYHQGVFGEFDGCQKGEFLTITGLTESGGNLVQRYFVPAERQLRIAVDLDGDLAEAALHLGRIQMLQGRDEEAAVLFERASHAPSRPAAYLARLFLGSFAERAGKWDDAEKAYRGAAALFAGGQSAAVALAQLLDGRGRGPEGAQLLVRTLATPSPRNVDPWWLYFEEIGVDNASRISLMRAEVLR